MTVHRTVIWFNLKWVLTLSTEQNYFHYYDYLWHGKFTRCLLRISSPDFGQNDDHISLGLWIVKKRQTSWRGVSLFVNQTNWVCVSPKDGQKLTLRLVLSSSLVQFVLVSVGQLRPLCTIVHISWHFVFSSATKRKTQSEGYEKFNKLPLCLIPGQL